MKTIVKLSLLLIVLSSCKDKTSVRWVQSTNDAPWIERIFNNSDIATSVLYTIEEDSVAHHINGWGACFNEMGWEALQMLTEEERQEILKGFFDPENGLKLTNCRMPIGANDYAISWYSLNDSVDDFAMKYFNIDRDKGNLVPYIKEAMKYNPALQVWGSPWCPPAWMKGNNHYACRPDSDVNDLDEKGGGTENNTQFIMEEEYLQAYALYFQKYVEAYRAEGINITGVHVQNEMNSCQNFPSCIWTAEDLTHFIGDYLGPQFEKSKLGAEIWYGTVERPYVEKIDTVMDNKKAAQYISGIGFQWAGKGAIEGVHEKYPGMRLMQTESECGNGSNDWAAAEHTWGLLKHYLNAGANVYTYWNMILDETGKSQWGWKQNSLISVDSKSKTFVYNPEYYLFKHFTHFVAKGAGKIDIQDGDGDLLAFVNPSGELVVLAGNTTDTEKNVTLEYKSKKYNFSLDAKSFSTILIGEQ